MENIVNTKHDVDSYESFDYKHEIFDINLLYNAFCKVRKTSGWKIDTHKFRMNLLTELSQLQKELKDRTYKLSPTSDFMLNERGKTRPISGQCIKDKIVGHVICDEFLIPELKKYVIYNNTASQKNKGVKFAREQLVKNLINFYFKNNSNKGYILLIDFSKYYDNIRHDVLKKIIRKYIHNEDVLWVFDLFVDSQKVDVSYMSDEEYENCMNVLFDSVEYRNLVKDNQMTGEKFMCKHLDLGNQVSQIAGIIYPIQIDNYVKIVKGVKHYGRYMDDLYIIHEDKQFLRNLLNDINDICKELGITINTKKTKVWKLSDNWKYLQVYHSLTDTGRIIRKINKKRLVDFKRKAKKLIHIIEIKEFENWFNSWFNSYKKLMSKKQRKNLEELKISLIKDKQKGVLNNEIQIDFK